MIARIDAFIADEARASRVPGLALAIVHEDQIVHARGFGSAGNGRQVTTTTPFPIGSLTKSFTAVLVRQLIDAGKVEPDAPLQRYLPWFTLADPQAAARITVRHLLNQTSGLSRAAGIEPLLHGSRASIEELARSLDTVAPTGPAGAQFEYSNLNYVLLGALVEAVSAQSWAQALQERVLMPLDLRNTHPELADARRDGLTALHRY